jgi:hypothetical protein
MPGRFYPSFLSLFTHAESFAENHIFDNLRRSLLQLLLCRLTALICVSASSASSFSHACPALESFCAHAAESSQSSGNRTWRSECAHYAHRFLQAQHHSAAPVAVLDKQKAASGQGGPVHPKLASPLGFGSVGVGHHDTQATAPWRCIQ